MNLNLRTPNCERSLSGVEFASVSNYGGKLSVSLEAEIQTEIFSLGLQALCLL